MIEELDVQRAANKGLGERREETLVNLWRHLHAHFGEHSDVGAIDAAAVDAYEGARRKEGARGQTIRREVQALVRGLRLAKRSKLLARLPFDTDDLDAIESDEPRAEQEGKARERADILAVLGKLSAKARTAGYHHMLRLIWKTGLRLEEFRRIGAAPDLRPAPPGSRAAAVLWLPPKTTKTGRRTGKGRALPLDKECVATLEKWGPRFAEKKFNHALKLASAAAGVAPTLTPRDLRATYLDEAARLSGDPAAAQKLGGHTNIATTGLYLAASTARALEAGVRVAKAVGKGPRQGATAKGERKKA